MARTKQTTRAGIPDRSGRATEQRPNKLTETSHRLPLSQAERGSAERRQLCMKIRRNLPLDRTIERIERFLGQSEDCRQAEQHGNHKAEFPC